MTDLACRHHAAMTGHDMRGAQIVAGALSQDADHDHEAEQNDLDRQHEETRTATRGHARQAAEDRQDEAARWTLTDDPAPRQAGEGTEGRSGFQAAHPGAAQGVVRRTDDDNAQGSIVVLTMKLQALEAIPARLQVFVND